jgi:hypothetical protein
MPQPAIRRVAGIRDTIVDMRPLDGLLDGLRGYLLAHWRPAWRVLR